MREEYEEFRTLVLGFEKKSKVADIRPKVLHLVKVLKSFRSLGVSLTVEDTNSARKRILLYFQKYPFTIISGDELLIVSGIQEYARRLRELRNKFGWPIISSETAKQMLNEGVLSGYSAADLKKDSYILINEVRDKEGADRFNFMGDLRKSPAGVHDKLLMLLQANVGRPISGEELKYVAKGATEWARRVRELRTEHGWPIVTKSTGKPSLPVGFYELVENRQDEVHDRVIPISVRIKVFDRDDNQCRKCGWPKNSKGGDLYRNRLECHHIEHHKNKGKNNVENLITLCNIDHDELHKLDKKGTWSKAEFIQWLSNDG